MNVLQGLEKPSMGVQDALKWKVSTVQVVSPKIYLVSKPAVDWEAIEAFLIDEELPSITESVRAAGIDDASVIAEVAARLCYMSYGKGRRDISDFIANLLSSKDGSVFEHINYGFVFTGVSRSLTHELVRHRAGFAYSQRSQRYVDESEARFVAPPIIADMEGSEALRVFEEAITDALWSYTTFMDAVLHDTSQADASKNMTTYRKALRQAARSVLPNATETKIFVTGNVRAWRHFIELRGSSFADTEIRNLALMVLEVLQAEAPLFFGDFDMSELKDGSRIAVPKYSKV